MLFLVRLSRVLLSWYDEVSGRELPFFSVLKVHQLLDRLRERTAAKLLHLPPPLTPAGGSGPPSASLPNTIPAAEFLSPSLDQILLAGLSRQRQAKKNNRCKDTTTPAIGTSDLTTPASGSTAAQSRNTKAGSLCSPRSFDSGKDSCPPSPSLLRGDRNEANVGEDIATAHDTRDPCCCGAVVAREGVPHRHSKGISACQFGQYYPLGSSLVRRAIKAFGGCPLCCTGSCGGAPRYIEDKQTSAGGAAEGEGDSPKRGVFWGSPAPLVPFGGCEKAPEGPTLEATLASVESSSVRGVPPGETRSETGDGVSSSRTHNTVLPCGGDGVGEDKDAAEGISALQASPRKDCRKRHPRGCSRTRTGTSSSSNSVQPVLKGNRPKRSSAATAAHVQTRLVPPLSLHDNRGFRRSAWDALEISLCELLAEAEADDGGPSACASSKEGSRDCRLSRPRKASLLTPAEVRMLLVVLQSRLGYVGDLRELPLSAVKNYPYEIAGVGAALRQQLLKPRLGAPPVPLAVPPPPSVQRLRMQQAALEMSLQQEQRVQVYPFSASAASSADKLVVDGWGWLPLFLCLQVAPFIVTEATVQSICVRQQIQSGEPIFAAASSSAPFRAPEGPRGADGRAGAGSQSEEEGGKYLSFEDEDADWGPLARTHPVRLRVEVNRRLRHCTSHGLPRAEAQEEGPTHVW